MHFTKGFSQLFFFPITWLWYIFKLSGINYIKTPNFETKFWFRQIKTPRIVHLQRGTYLTHKLYDHTEDLWVFKFDLISCLWCCLSKAKKELIVEHGAGMEIMHPSDFCRPLFWESLPMGYSNQFVCKSPDTGINYEAAIFKAGCLPVSPGGALFRYLAHALYVTGVSSYWMYR